MTTKVTFLTAATVALFSTTLVFERPLEAQVACLGLEKTRGYLDRSLAEVMSEAVGPQGAQVFNVWARDAGPPVLAGLLVTIEGCLAVGGNEPGRFDFYTTVPQTTVRSVVFTPSHPFPLQELQVHLAAPFEWRRCVPAEAAEGLDAPLALSSQAGSSVNLAVLPGQRLVVEMFREPGQVTAVRWVGGGASLDGCP